MAIFFPKTTKICIFTSTRTSCLPGIVIIEFKYKKTGIKDYISIKKDDKIPKLTTGDIFFLFNEKVNILSDVYEKKIKFQFHIFKTEIEALYAYYIAKNNALKKIIDYLKKEKKLDEEIYFKLYKKCLVYYEIEGDNFKDLLKYCKSKYTNDESFQDKYEDYRISYRKTDYYLKRQYLRIILTSSTNPTSDPFLNFFKKYPGLRKFIGFELIKYI